MIQRHQDLKKYIGQGVVYVDNGIPRKLRIIGVVKHLDKEGEKTVFNSSYRIPRSLQMEFRDQPYYSPLLVREIGEEKLYSNVSEYVNVRTEQVRQEINDLEMTLLKLKLKSEPTIDVGAELRKVLEKYSSRTKLGVSTLKEMKSELQYIEEKCTPSGDVQERVRKVTDSLNRLKRELKKLTRRENSRRIQLEWSRTQFNLENSDMNA